MADRYSRDKLNPAQIEYLMKKFAQLPAFRVNPNDTSISPNAVRRLINNFDSIPYETRQSLYDESLKAVSQYQLPFAQKSYPSLSYSKDVQSAGGLIDNFTSGYGMEGIKPVVAKKETSFDERMIPSIYGFGYEPKNIEPKTVVDAQQESVPSQQEYVPSRENVQMIDSGQSIKSSNNQSLDLLGGKGISGLLEAMSPVVEKMAQKRGFLSKQEPTLVQEAQYKTTPIVERRVDPYMTINPSGIISEAPKTMTMQQLENYKQAQLARPGADPVFGSDVYRKSELMGLGSSSPYTDGRPGSDGITKQVSAPIYEYDLSGIQSVEEARAVNPKIEDEIIEDLKGVIKPDAQVDYGRLARALAIGFNTLRTFPDQQLQQGMFAQIEADRKRRASGKTLTAIVDFLNKNDYQEYANVALQNPDLAMDIYKQVIQKELSPGAGSKTSGVQYDEEQNAFVVISDASGGTTVKYLTDPEGNQIKGEDRQSIINAELEARKLEDQYKISSKRSDEVMNQARTTTEQLGLYREALQTLNEGAESGWIRSKLPAFNAQTAKLRSIASKLGISVINSATFGALSEKELQLALQTNLNLDLDGPELRKLIIDKINATEKLAYELTTMAAEMSSMPYNEYIQLQKQRADENKKYLKRPDDVSENDWALMNIEQKKEYFRRGVQ